jgi:hypothetical protein
VDEVVGNHADTRLNAAVITINCGMRLQRRGRIVEKRFYVFMQRALIALQRQGVIAVPSMIFWAMSRWQLRASTVTIAPLRVNNSRSFGTAVI